MNIKIIYENKDLMVVDKPAGIIVFEEGKNPSASSGPFLINELIKRYPELKSVEDQPRYGIVHRLDKDTSGVLLVAKTNEALIFLQKCFKNREVEKKYVCLVEGLINEDKGEIKTLIARAKGDPRKQKAYSSANAPKSAREAITEYKVLQRFTQSNPAEGGSAKPNLTRVQDYTLLEVEIKTGRRHQIRCHLSYLQHPIAGDKLYAFKNSKIPDGLTRQFLHAKQLKIQLPSGQIKEFISELPEELLNVLTYLKLKI